MDSSSHECRPERNAVPLIPGPNATILPFTLEATMDVGGFWRAPIAMAIDEGKVMYLAVSQEGPPTWVPEDDVRRLHLRHAG